MPSRPPSRFKKSVKSQSKSDSNSSSPRLHHSTVVEEKPEAMYFWIEHSDHNRFAVNANCLCKLIYEYIRLKAGLPDEMEFDLCDVEGNFLGFYESDEGAMGRDLFDHKKVYYIVLLQRTRYGRLYDPRIHLDAAHPDFTRLMRFAMKVFERVSKFEDGKKKKKRKPPPEKQRPQAPPSDFLMRE